MKIRTGSLEATLAPYPNEITHYFTHPKFTRTGSGAKEWEKFVREHEYRITYLIALHCAMVEEAAARHVDIDTIVQGEVVYLVYSQYNLAWYNFLAITKASQKELAEMFAVINTVWKYAKIFSPYNSRLLEEEKENIPASAVIQCRFGC